MTKPWINPIDGFVLSPALQHGAEVLALPEESNAQHCPVLCSLKVAASDCQRLIWERPQFSQQPPWPAAATEDFYQLLSQGLTSEAWNLWVQFSLGQTAAAAPALKTKEQSCLVVSQHHNQQLARCYKLQRKLLRKQHVGEWTHADSDLWNKLDTELSTLVLEGRKKALTAWKDRMCNLSLAAAWSRARQLHALKLRREDGAPALSNLEKGEAVLRQWAAVWTNPADAATTRLAAARQFARQGVQLTDAWTPCPQLAPWTPQRINSCAPTPRSAPGPDGITSDDLCHLASEHLDQLAALFNAISYGAPIPEQWCHARLVTIPKACGGPRPLTVLNVVYRTWARGVARELSDWSLPWFDACVVGGIKGTKPASVTAALFSSRLSEAFLRKQPMYAAFLDTSKCFDSVILNSFDEVLRAFQAPEPFLHITQMWRMLQRHVWVDSEPTGVTICPTDLRGIPQGDPLAPLALNLIMHCWVKNLPQRPLESKVYLDDRGLLDPDPLVLDSVLQSTQPFDHAFGFSVDVQTSVRLAVWPRRQSLRPCSTLAALPSVQCTRYLGSSIEAQPALPMKLGTERAKQTISQLERTRALPQQDIRETLACAQMQILHPEGACVPVKICDKVRTAMVRAIWGPTLEPNNTMRSVAATLGLFVPLHVAAPHINCLYQAVICMAHVQVQLPAIARSLWEFRHKPWQGHVGFAKLFMRQIQTQGWNWISPDRIQTSGSCEVVLSSLRWS